ncbi:MAG: DUF131 domain-containing protein [Thermoprotei archaeon]
MFKVFLALIFVGFLIMSVAAVLTAVESNTQSNASFGGVLLIGPLPIVFGYGKLATQLSELSVILTIVAIIFFLMPLFIKRK